MDLVRLDNEKRNFPNAKICGYKHLFGYKKVKD